MQQLPRLRRQPRMYHHRRLLPHDRTILLIGETHSELYKRASSDVFFFSDAMICSGAGLLFRRWGAGRPEAHVLRPFDVVSIPKIVPAVQHYAMSRSA